MSNVLAPEAAYGVPAHHCDMVACETIEAEPDEVTASRGTGQEAGDGGVVAFGARNTVDELCAKRPPLELGK